MSQINNYKYIITKNEAIQPRMQNWMKWSFTRLFVGEPLRP